MRHLSLALVLALSALGTPASANVIQRACLQADRPAATPQLCGCIQSVANLTLGQREQRKAAKFFGDPHLAQETRQSDRASDERFWDSYKQFGTTAAELCAS